MFRAERKRRGEGGNMKQGGDMKQLLSAYLLAQAMFTKVNLINRNHNNSCIVWHQYSLFCLWCNRLIFVYVVLKTFTR